MFCSSGHSFVASIAVIIDINAFCLFSGFKCFSTRSNLSLNDVGVTSPEVDFTVLQHIFRELGSISNKNL